MGSLSGGLDISRCVIIGKKEKKKEQQRKDLTVLITHPAMVKYERRNGPN
jgi:NH3-dependent NAD+ synthetase